MAGQKPGRSVTRPSVYAAARRVSSGTPRARTSASAKRASLSPAGVSVSSRPTHRAAARSNRASPLTRAQYESPAHRSGLPGTARRSRLDELQVAGGQRALKSAVAEHCDVTRCSHAVGLPVPHDAPQRGFFSDGPLSGRLEPLRPPRFGTVLVPAGDRLTGGRRSGCLQAHRARQAAQLVLLIKSVALVRAAAPVNACQPPYAAKAMATMLCSVTCPGHHNQLTTDARPRGRRHVLQQQISLLFTELTGRE